ncbi:MAG: DUF87 domain-containing protein [Patescibacteria group bacterium]
MTAIFILFPVLAVLIGAVIFFQRGAIKNLLSRSLQLRVLLIRLPQNFETKKDFKEEISLSSQLYSILAGLKLPFALEAAVSSMGQEIIFYLAVPQTSLDFVVKQVLALWSDAQIEPTDDYTVFNSQGAATAIYLKQKNHYALPVRTFNETNADTFLPILSNLSKLQPIGEGIAIQIIAKSAPESAKKNISSIIAKLRQGIQFETAVKWQAPKISEKKTEAAPPIVNEEEVKLLTEKILKPLFSVNVRLVASGATSAQADELLNSLAGSFSQFAAPGHNEFKAMKPRNPKELLYKFIFREFDERHAMILGTDELASIFHLPTSVTAIPNIKWLKAKEAPPPLDLPAEGVQLGSSFFRGESKPVFVTDEDRRRHLYVVGQTGTGKSNLLVRMAMDDIKRGGGTAVIDPHGDLLDSILGLIPENRRKDVIIFDPGDVARPVGLNMLEYNADNPSEKTFIVNELQGIFNKLFAAETMGPIFEQYMRNALLLLMEDIHTPATLLEVPRIFTDVAFRKDKLARIRNPAVVDFWEKEAVKAGGDAALANITPYVTSKFNNFIANDYVRPIIGQARSSFNFRKVMDEGKILLVNLSKGRIGDINAGLLGMIIVGKLLMAALSRVDVSQEQRKDFNLYIDEFQNFTTDSIATILSEARKYRLNLVVAHQFISQLAEKIRDAVFGNVGSMIVFRVGADDADYLAKHFEPVFSKNDLINIDNFNAYAKLLINGRPAQSFNIRTLPPLIGDEQTKVAIKEFSRNTYGRSREDVEKEVVYHLRG